MSTKYHDAYCPLWVDEDECVACRPIDSLPASAEVKVIDPITGAAKGSKAERFDLLPWDFIAELARLYGKGAEKYDERNWEKGYKVSLSFAALERHITQWWAGEDYDSETGCSHLASVAFHAAAMYRFTHDEDLPAELDNRP